MPIQYSSCSTDISYFEDTLYRSGCGRIDGRRREHREQSLPVSKHQIQLECGE